MKKEIVFWIVVCINILLWSAVVIKNHRVHESIEPAIYKLGWMEGFESCQEYTKYYLEWWHKSPDTLEIMTLFRKDSTNFVTEIKMMR